VYPHMLLLHPVPPGQRFAVMEEKVILASILRYFNAEVVSEARRPPSTKRAHPSPRDLASGSNWSRGISISTHRLCPNDISFPLKGTSLLPTNLKALD
jgi:hypothetical protein